MHAFLVIVLSTWLQYVGLVLASLKELARFKEHQYARDTDRPTI